MSGVPLDGPVEVLAGALTRLGAPPAGAARLAAELVTAYDDPARAYHDRRHLADVLRGVAQLAGHTRSPDAVLVAAGFHDAVHDGRPDDEERSAALAEERLRALGLAPPAVAEVARLVRLTIAHDPGPGDADGAVLCDADLAVLGADPARYGEYAAAVRREYAAVPDAVFARERARVLRALLGRVPLYSTDAARSAWEAAARANVAAEVTRLEAVAAGAAPRPATGG